jgi:predicted glycoside hydrolase/deacetylase ChbG (UPF0249 family)
MVDGYTNQLLEVQKEHIQERHSLIHFYQQIRSIVARRHKAEEKSLKTSSESKALRRRHQREWAELSQSECLSNEFLGQQQGQELADLAEKSGTLPG